MRTPLLPVAVATVLLALTGCASNAEPQGAASVPAPTATTALPTPASMPTLDEKTACVRAIHAVADGTNIIAALAANPDGSTIDQIQLATTIIDMRTLQPSMPERLGDDLADLVEPLEQLQKVLTTGVNQTIETGTYASRGPGLIIGCGRYTK